MDILGLGLEVSPPKQRNAKKSRMSGSVAPEEKEIFAADHQASTQDHQTGGITQSLPTTELDVSQSKPMHGEFGGDEGEVRSEGVGSRRGIE